MPLQVKDATGATVSIMTPDEVSAITVAALAEVRAAIAAQATTTQAQPVSGTVSIANFPAAQAVAGEVSVGNFPATQAVSAAALPLPSGAATQSTLAGILALLQSASVHSTVDNWPATQAVSLAAAPLPAGAATDSTLAAVLAKLSADPATAAGVAAVLARLGDTLAISAAALPLPAGAATEATLALLSGALRSEDTPATSGDAGLPLLAQRHDTDAATTDTDGDYSLLKMDEEGRLKVGTKPASIAPAGGVANAVGNSIACDVRRASNVVFHVKNAGSLTLAAGTFVFEASVDSTTGTDGTWFGIQAVRSNANTIETSIALSGIAAGAGYAASWEASVNGYSWMRLRCTVAVTASASAQWTIQRGSYATEPIPAAQISGTQPVSGTVTANWGTLTTPTASAINSAATTNATSVKATAGTLYNVAAFNSGAAAAYVKVYNKASAPTVGTDVPVAVVAVPAGASVVLPFGTLGYRFATGIALAITGGAADSDTTAVAAAQVKVATTYI